MHRLGAEWLESSRHPVSLYTCSTSGIISHVCSLHRITYVSHVYITITYVTYTTRHDNHIHHMTRHDNHVHHITRHDTTRNALDALCVLLRSLIACWLHGRAKAGVPPLRWTASIAAVLLFALFCTDIDHLVYLFSRGQVSARPDHT